MNAPSTAIATTSGGALVASLATEGGAMTVAQLKANRDLMKQAMSELMEPGKHYGKVPGTGSKPTLLKPGAELLCVLFRVNAEPDVEDLSTVDCIRYRVKLKGVHIPTGQVIAWGVGEASTDEEKYKWREAKCREEFAEAPDDRKRWKWKGDRGPDDGVNQVRTNPADAANTILKMAEKRAKCDLALAFSACSDVFAQDLDNIAEWLRDRVVEDEGDEVPPSSKSGTRPPQKRSATSTAAAAPSGQVAGDPKQKINAGQLDVLNSHIDASGVREVDFFRHFNVDRLEDLPFLRLNEALMWCKNQHAEPT